MEEEEDVAMKRMDVPLPPREAPVDFLPPSLGEGWGGGTRDVSDPSGPRAPIPTFPQRGKEQQP
jgi:hypothetical protein